MFFSKKLKKFNHIKHCFFSKKGGFSSGIYRSLNCGRGSKDSKKKIRKNLQVVCGKMKINRKNLLLMHQTHSNKVIVINKKNRNSKNFKSDALVTGLENLALGVVTADCVPILLYDVRNKVIGCIHAGWRGAINKIIENTLKQFKPNSEIYACVGPCIGKKSYEVNLKFYKNFIVKSNKNKIYFSKKNKEKKFFNLRKYVSDKLVSLKVKLDHINFDTFSEKSKFFSYRRSFKLKEKDYGRCISVIYLSKFSQN